MYFHYNNKTVRAAFTEGVLLVLLIGSLFAAGCSSSKHAAVNSKDKVLLAERDAGWLKYKVYLQPATDTAANKKRPRNMQLSIMVINMHDNTSPLRKIVTDLEQYNICYEYLLNRCKDDLHLYDHGKVLYPIAYSFENNYNAFPFETINVGYRYDLNKRKNRHMQGLVLEYADRVFAKDTIVFNLNNQK
jgi:hypothetical protein